MCRQSRILFRRRAEHTVDNNVGFNLVTFAMEKLLGTSATSHYDDGQNLAILARRIPIDMRTNTSAALMLTNRQLAQHMRVLYAVTDDNETLITGSPSEPIVSEGAKTAMSHTGFDVVNALGGILKSPGISVGERGEMMAELLLILASDAATVEAKGKFSIPTFFEHLLTDSSWNVLKGTSASRGAKEFHAGTFQHTFKNSYGNFNHIIKVHNNVLESKSWYRHLSRRAGISARFGERGIDGAFPITINGTKIAPDNISCLVFQIKAVEAMQRPSKLVFDKMDDPVLGTDDSDDTDSTSAKPVIRLVFSLRSHEKDVIVMKYTDDYDNELLTWDIFVLFSSLRAVKKNPKAWQTVLDMASSEGKMYGSNVTLMGMDPGAGIGDNFWPNWVTTGKKTTEDGSEAKAKASSKGKGRAK
ncbi:hypothetical protein DACRYDRAFT_21934 [Dacryopinax primogenitus]|uniref:Uncharacterized protein n=1 Tax=Dacryopinax primogenitus (strain DJM 731) TaxID=1858805 RepID=M5G8N8_DACPD|nr:uncharacterized protein DACRYDRAFT_21934 [Dacryopinax primogenitus]EJU02202.1 hypothetical protein DACRYDRAFT_21934 [Dacryopinax primogenitus]